LPPPIRSSGRPRPITFPSLGHLLHASAHGFGLWAGTAVNDVSSVAATSAVFGHGAAGTAIITKLTRTLMIIPITLVLAWWKERRSVVGSDTRRPSLVDHVRRTFPKFILWFLLAVALDTVGLIPLAWHADINVVSQFLITVALGAIGLSTRPRDIRRAGGRPLALGAILWLFVSVTSLSLLILTGQFHAA
jgi:uncharacterized membrane protein YadS